MGENSKIEWTDHTFNPWTGCTRVSEGCQHCYAESWALRSGLVKWGPSGERRRTSAQNWRQPLKWNREAAKAGRRKRVFCASLADVFDDHPSIATEWRIDLAELIVETQFLEWLLLSKRPERIDRAWLPHNTANVRIGVTAENQMRAEERIPELLKHWSGPNFISYEPALGPVNFGEWIESIDWIIAGGESGSGARPMPHDWARDVRDQCASAKVPFFMKQMGGATNQRMQKIPDDLFIREFPGSSRDMSVSLWR